MMAAEIPRHKVFISFHDEDKKYKDRFVLMMGDGIVNRSVDDDDIDDANIKVDTIRQKIREGFIADASVTIVLIGPCAWQRKHVDWEISYSLRETDNTYRSGLVGILLPNHPEFQKSNKVNPHLIPPRLVDNCVGDYPYASLHRWSGRVNQVNSVRSWIHEAFKRRKGTLPNNSRPQFGQNRHGECSKGWQS